VKSGDIVRVKVLEVDVGRKRIALTLRLDDEAGAERPKTLERNDKANRSFTARKPSEPSGGGALAEAMRRAAEKNAQPR
jgi:uncharacterized protein